MNVSTMVRRVRCRIAAVLAGVTLVGLLTGCGGSDSSILYVLFDSSESSSQLIREGYTDGAVLMGVGFCKQHPRVGEIVFNTVSPSPEADSQFESLQCPERKNATDFRTRLLVFRTQLRAAVDGTIGVQASRPGSDIAGSILFGANQTLARFKPKSRYLVVFSDMQQSGLGIRNCVKRQGMAGAARCIDVYFEERPELASESKELQDTAIFVTGVGQTIRGRLSDAEGRAFQGFWRAFFKREGGKVCWYASTTMPETRNADGTIEIASKYFDADCPPIPGW